jgi:exopolysaccharide biosynthesis polyprenyl glycosylphosphotransferase
MLRQQARTLHRTLVAFDAALAFGVFWLAFALRNTAWLVQGLGLPELDARREVWLGAVLAAVAVPLALRWVGAYGSHRRDSLAAVVVTVGKASLVAALLLVGGAFLLELGAFTRGVLAIFVALNFAALVAQRLALFAGLRSLRARGYNYRNLVVLGTGPRARRLAGEIEAHPAWGLRIRGFADDDPREADRAAVGERYLGKLRELVDLLRVEVIDEVLFALPRRFFGLDSTANAIALCDVYGIDFTIASDLFDTRIAEPRFHDMLGVPCLTLAHRRHGQGWQPAVKRVLDVVGALLAIALTSPIWIAAAIAIKLDSPGPVFFVQQRSGRNNRPFPCVKFRTMVVDAEARLEELRKRNEISGPVFKVKDDPRLTRAGRVLRKYSIDELPQFLNVLVGQMSLVGPRPPIPKEVRSYEPDQVRRLSVRPGITGLWQVSGRNRIAFEDWVRLDLQYIDEWSLWLDFQILVATIPAVLGGEGAS